MLAVHRITKRFPGAQAPSVQELTLQVNAGELYALLGPNGAGKTTTLNCLLGFVKPDEGTVRIDGIDVATHPAEAKRRVAYIPEQVNLYPYFTGVENLAYFSELAGYSYSKTQLQAYLRDAGLQDEAHRRRVAHYSKGMRQKVGIAIALAKKAKALLLDEPTSGLDPSASHEFSALLRQLRDRDVAILMATHDLFRAKDDATRVGIMRHGKLVQELREADLRHADLEKLYLESMRDGADRA